MIKIIIHKENGSVFAECDRMLKLISNEQDTVDLIGLCGYHQTNNLLIYAQNVDENFFDLKSKLAGKILQKCMNYHIRLAMVLPSDMGNNIRFSEMALETNKGNHFRIFKTRDEAVEWLVNG